jgi:hypothetical protein
MNKALLTVAIGIGLAGAASAQARFGDVTTSTDPAKAAAIERHAAELKAGSMHHMAQASKSAARHHTQHATMHHQTESKAPAKS